MAGRQTTTVPPVTTTVTALNTSETVYEAGGRVDMTCSYPAGGSCAGTTSTRTWSPAYDAMGRVLTANLRENGTTRVTTTTAWNVDGQVASTSENGDTLTYGYDTSGRPTTVSRASVALTTVAYDATGRVASRTDRYADGTTGTTTFAYG